MSLVRFVLKHPSPTPARPSNLVSVPYRLGQILITFEPVYNVCIRIRTMEPCQPDKSGGADAVDGAAIGIMV